MSGDAALEQLNAVEYLGLQELSEPTVNSLRIIVKEAVVNRSASGRPVFPGLPQLTEILRDAWPIESTEGCRTFELYWKSYAAYLVTNESVGSTAAGGYEDEVFTGKLFRAYSESHFLAHLARDTGPIDPLQHYKLICLNHLIDVAAYAPPEIRVTAAPPRERASS
jgi:hypothetical protein